MTYTGGHDIHREFGNAYVSHQATDAPRLEADVRRNERIDEHTGVRQPIAGHLGVDPRMNGRPVKQAG